MFRGTHHTVLLFTGLDDDARPAVELCRIAEQLEQAYPGLVKARVVSAERFADHPAALGDPDAVGASPVRNRMRHAHSSYGPTNTSATADAPSTSTGCRPIWLDG